jgi:uncharacterized protein (UPF0332 family)
MESESNNRLYEAQLWLDRAKETIDASNANFENDFLLTAVNRAYYAMFYCATALLLTENVFAKSHSGTINKFSELFIKTNLFSTVHSSNLRSAFEYRQSGDYDIEAVISEQEAQILIQNASEFYDTCLQYFEGLIQNTI